MRKLIFAINITLDGCVDHTKQVADDETHEYFTDVMSEVDLLVFGRITYQLMVPFWPEVAKSQSMTKASNEFARAFDSIDKIVFSRSLDKPDDRNTRIVRANLHDEILKLKQEAGKSILLGGVSIPSQLIELGLVDEYRFVVGPIVVGEGRRLLEGVSAREIAAETCGHKDLRIRMCRAALFETVTQNSATTYRRGLAQLSPLLSLTWLCTKNTLQEFLVSFTSWLCTKNTLQALINTRGASTRFGHPLQPSFGQRITPRARYSCSCL